MGMSRLQFEQMIAMIMAAQQFRNGGYYQQNGSYHQQSQGGYQGKAISSLHNQALRQPIPY